jgi:hypothetical protein
MALVACALLVVGAALMLTSPVGTLQSATFVKIGTATAAANRHPAYRASRTRCQRGPYVWDRSKHVEGIGSTFQYRKQSLAMADAIRAPWIGTLVNEHESEPRDNHAAWFGLGADDCNEMTLKQFKQDSTMKFIDASELYHRPDFDMYHLCAGTIKPTDYRSKYGLDEHTVIEVRDSEHHLREDWNYCVFNERFRTRFFNAQVRNFSQALRPENEYWVSVHFRWGDLQTSDVENPSTRGGHETTLGLTHLARKAATYINAVPRRLHVSTRVFFMSEGEQSTFQRFKDIVPTAEFRLNDKWTDSMWIEAQSNVLIGGLSGFFVVGAHLCSNCTVLTVNSTVMKFKPHSVESSDHHIVLAEAVPPRPAPPPPRKRGFHTSVLYSMAMSLMLMLAATLAVVACLGTKRSNRRSN